MAGVTRALKGFVHSCLSQWQSVSEPAPGVRLLDKGTRAGVTVCIYGGEKCTGEHCKTGDDHFRLAVHIVVV